MQPRLAWNVDQAWLQLKSLQAPSPVITGVYLCSALHIPPGIRLRPLLWFIEAALASAPGIKETLCFWKVS